MVYNTPRRVLPPPRYYSPFEVSVARPKDVSTPFDLSDSVMAENYF